MRSVFLRHGFDWGVQNGFEEMRGRGRIMGPV